MLLARGSNIFIQAAYFVILARTLGTKDYGEFIGVTALAGIAAPFSGWGSHLILVKNVSRNRELFNVYWGNALFLIAVSGGMLTALSLLVAPLLIETPLILVLLIFLADLIALQAVVAAGAAYVAVDDLKQSAMTRVLLSVLKLAAAAILLIWFPGSGVITWTTLYCASTVLTAIIVVLMVSIRLGAPQLSLSRIASEAREGFYFSIGLSSDVINSNLDKSMLASMSTFEAAGVYGAGSRVVDIGYVPIMSVMSAAYASFFRHGSAGISGSWQFAKRLTPLAIGYGGLAALLLIFAAPIVPLILGDEYIDAIPVLRWLSPVLLIGALQLLAADALTGADFQGLRSGIQASSALLNFLLNFWLIPIFSWRGAIWATLITEVAKLLGLYALIYVLGRRQSVTQR